MAKTIPLGDQTLIFTDLGKRQSDIGTNNYDDGKLIMFMCDFCVNQHHFFDVVPCICLPSTNLYVFITLKTSHTGTPLKLSSHNMLLSLFDNGRIHLHV